MPQFDWNIGKTEAKNDPQVDAAAYVEAIIEGMPPLVGYASILLDDHGRRIAFVRRGWAISPLDSGSFAATPLTLDTKIAWGSSVKMITTAAALQTIERYSELNLDRHFVDFLPKRWRDETADRFRTVSLRMLLQHRGGFRKSGGTWSFGNFRVRLATGDAGNNRPDVGVRQYSNASMGAFHFIMGNMVLGPAWQAHREEALKNLSDDEYDETVVKESARWYRIVVQQMLRRLGSDAGTGLLEMRADGMPIALSYSNRADTTGTTNKDGKHHPAAGGWCLSTKEMTNFIHALHRDRNIISGQMLGLVENRSNLHERLGWAGSSTKFEGGVTFKHSGKTRGYNSRIFSLPNGYHASVVTNTSEGSGEIGRVLRDAYNAALRGPTLTS